MATLRFGSSGEEVKLLQTILNVSGFDCGLADGKFGEKTFVAVRLYQAARKLTIDGAVGKRTWGSLLAEPAIANVRKPRTDHFSFEEFACPDGTQIPIQYYGNVQTLMNWLEVLRRAANERYGQDIRIIIRSGYRAPAYNKRVGGASGSQHLTASAVDIYAVRVTTDGVRQTRVPNCYQLAMLCNELWPSTGGFGLGSNTNLHIDLRPRRTIWWYNYKTWSSWQRGQGAMA